MCFCCMAWSYVATPHCGIITKKTKMSVIKAYDPLHAANTQGYLISRSNGAAVILKNPREIKVKNSK